MLSFLRKSLVLKKKTDETCHQLVIAITNMDLFASLNVHNIYLWDSNSLYNVFTINLKSEDTFMI